MPRIVVNQECGQLAPNRLDWVACYYTLARYTEKYATKKRVLPLFQKEYNENFASVTGLFMCISYTLYKQQLHSIK